MVMAILTFCNPPARIWVPAKEIIDMERAKQHGERVLMGMEEGIIRKIFAFQKVRMKRECHLMGLEEGCRDVFKAWDMKEQVQYG